MTDLTHLDESGHARMVDVGDKPDTERVAVARAEVHISPEILALVREGKANKGDVLAVARVAGIMAAKKTPELIMFGGVTGAAAGARGGSATGAWLAAITCCAG